MLVGDDNKIPGPSYPGGNNIKSDVSDNFYADMDGDDLPDVVISRLPINNYNILSNYINRVINYETNPPTNPSYYLNPITSMSWHSHTDNMILAEATNGFFANILEKEPVRINAIFEGTPGNEWECDEQYDLLFGPDGLAYVPATPEYLIDWSGDAQQINNALNDGTFLILNLDSGTEYGWSAPQYWSSDLLDLANPDPFFVFTINNLNGKFNWSFDVFAESLIKHPNASIGVIASTMTLDTLYPSIFYIQLLDAMWEDFIPSYNQSFISMDFARPAFANFAAKRFLGNLSNAEKTIYSFHYFGEPFSTVIYEFPTEMEIIHSETFEANAEYFDVAAPENSVICLSVDHTLYAVAEGTGSLLSIPIELLNCNDTLLVTVTKRNHLRYSANVVCENISSRKEFNDNQSEITIFPNPASSKLFLLNSNKVNDIKEVSIMNLKGEILGIKKSNSFDENPMVVDLRELTNGIYFIEIISEDSTIIQKIIISN